MIAATKQALAAIPSINGNGDDTWMRIRIASSEVNRSVGCKSIFAVFKVKFEQNRKLYKPGTHKCVYGDEEYFNQR